MALPALMLAGIIAIFGIHSAMPVLGDAMRQAAMVSAVMAMPDISVEVFEHYFEVQVYGGVLRGVDHDSIPFEPVVPVLTVPATPPIDVPPQNLPTAPESESVSPAPGTPPRDTPRRIPVIPPQYAAPIIAENFAGREGRGLLRHGIGFIRNETRFSYAYIREILEEPMALEFHPDSRPQVLIMHTHTTEAFERFDADYYDIRNTWRSTDNNINMAAVGAVMVDVLESYGIGVIHNTTQHDFPMYAGSYGRAAETIRGYLDEHPSIQIVLDLHRDAMPRGNAMIKPVAMINDAKTAQIMIIAGSDDGNMNMPYWRENLRFAAELQNYLEAQGEDLTRPVYLTHRRYNMDLSTGSLLLEIGSNANTLEEAFYAAELAGHALAALILNNLVEDE